MLEDTLTDGSLTIVVRDGVTSLLRVGTDVIAVDEKNDESVSVGVGVNIDASGKLVVISTTEDVRNDVAGSDVTEVSTAVLGVISIGSVVDGVIVNNSVLNVENVEICIVTEARPKLTVDAIVSTDVEGEKNDKDEEMVGCGVAKLDVSASTVVLLIDSDTDTDDVASTLEEGLNETVNTVVRDSPIDSVLVNAENKLVLIDGDVEEKNGKDEEMVGCGVTKLDVSASTVVLLTDSDTDTDDVASTLEEGLNETVNTVVRDSSIDSVLVNAENKLVLIDGEVTEKEGVIVNSKDEEMVGSGVAKLDVSASTVVLLIDSDTDTDGVPSTLEEGLNKTVNTVVRDSSIDSVLVNAEKRLVLIDGEVTEKEGVIVNISLVIVVAMEEVSSNVLDTAKVKEGVITEVVGVTASDDKVGLGTENVSITDEGLVSEEEGKTEEIGKEVGETDGTEDAEIMLLERVGVGVSTGRAVLAVNGVVEISSDVDTVTSSKLMLGVRSPVEVCRASVSVAFGVGESNSVVVCTAEVNTCGEDETLTTKVVVGVGMSSVAVEMDCVSRTVVSMARLELDEAIAKLLVGTKSNELTDTDSVVTSTLGDSVSDGVNTDVGNVDVTDEKDESTVVAWGRSDEGDADGNITEEVGISLIEMAGCDTVIVGRLVVSLTTDADMLTSTTEDESRTLVDATTDIIVLAGSDVIGEDDELRTAESATDWLGDGDTDGETRAEEEVRTGVMVCVVSGMSELESKSTLVGSGEGDRDADGCIEVTLDVRLGCSVVEEDEVNSDEGDANSLEISMLETLLVSSIDVDVLRATMDDDGLSPLVEASILGVAILVVLATSEITGVTMGLLLTLVLSIGKVEGVILISTAGEASTVVVGTDSVLIDELELVSCRVVATDVSTGKEDEVDMRRGPELVGLLRRGVGETGPTAAVDCDATSKVVGTSELTMLELVVASKLVVICGDIGREVICCNCELSGTVLLSMGSDVCSVCITSVMVDEDTAGVCVGRGNGVLL